MPRASTETWAPPRVRSRIAPGGVAGAGVDGGVGAEGEGVVELLLHDVDDDDAGAEGLGDEQRREADAAGAVDGEPLAGMQVGAAGEGVPGGGGAAAEGGGDGRRHGLGQAGEVVGEGDGDELGEGAGLDEAGEALVGAGVLVAGLAGRALAAGEDEGGDEAVADLPRRERAGLDDLAAVLVARDLAGLHPRVLAGPAVPVGAADAAGEGLEDDAVGLAGRGGGVLEGEVGVVFAEDGGAHGSPGFGAGLRRARPRSLRSRCWRGASRTSRGRGPGRRRRRSRRGRAR